MFVLFMNKGSSYYKSLLPGLIAGVLMRLTALIIKMLKIPEKLYRK